MTIRLTELIEPAEDFSTLKRPLLAVLNHVDDKLNLISDRLMVLEDRISSTIRREEEIIKRLDELEGKHADAKAKWASVAARGIDTISRISVVLVGVYFAAMWSAQ